MPTIFKFTCLYQFQTRRNLLRSCNIVQWVCRPEDLSWSLILARQNFFLLGPNEKNSWIISHAYFSVKTQIHLHQLKILVYYSMFLCFYHILDLCRIRKSLSLDLAKQIAVALVSSKLDYCNSIFHNMPEKDIARLQRVQNCLASVVIKAPRFSRSVPMLKWLHWLPVKFRIHFKICAITFRTLKENQPAYLADLLVRPKCSKYLRSTNSNRFVVPCIKTKTGSRAFSMSGPTLWKALPVPIRNAKTILTFRKLLKSHLFDLAFPS